MGDDVDDDVGVTGYDEIEAPIFIHSRLPEVARLVVLFGMQGRVFEIRSEKSNLFEERLADDYRRGFQGIQSTGDIVDFH